MPNLRPAIVLTSIVALCASAVILKSTRAADEPARPMQVPAALSPAAKPAPLRSLAAGARSGEEPVAPQASTQSLVPDTLPEAAKNGQPRTVGENGQQERSARTVGPDGPPVGRPQADRGPPGASRPEESATIRDDPTIAPDSKQSADNNVSFPSDI